MFVLMKPLKKKLTLKQLLCVLFLVNCLTPVKAQPCKEIVGYYPNWQWYDRAKLVQPNSIAYSKYSVINYCFFKPETSGLISNTDAWADENLLQGQINWSTTPTSYYPNTSIIDLAHNAGTKVMVSIGGWTLSDNFPTIAASTSLRATFAGECNRLLKFYKFDGIDIDWEYPGCATHSGTPADKQNFTIFMQQIRDSITALGQRENKTYLLSACFGASATYAANIEWNNIPNILDMINVMSYDFFGAWDCSANHNSPLYACGAGDDSFNLDSAFTMLTQQYAVPANKINLGVAFYGRSQTGATALYQPTNCGSDNVTFSADLGTPLYYNIVSQMALFDYYWDNAAAVPYLLGKSSGSASGTFVSYDNKKSVGMKASYVKNKNARGVIIWEITGDYLETSPGSGAIAGTPLIDTLNQVFCSSVTTGIEQPEENLVNVNVFPNPSSEQLTLTGNFSGEQILVCLYDLSGREISCAAAVIQEKNKAVFSVKNIPNGFYMLQIKQQGGSSFKNVSILIHH